MELKAFFTVFIAVFVAELGDKTQLATMMFASEKDFDKLTVFAGSAIALVVTSAIGVVAGSLLSQFIEPKILSYIAGTGFIAIGIYTLYSA